MGTEIERKFLVAGEDWRRQVLSKSRIAQGYLASSNEASVRVRTLDDAEGKVTIKSAGRALSRSEFEYDIPIADARDLLGLCGDRRLDKTRHRVPAGDLTWEIDVFEGRLAGLIVAEIELPHAQHRFEIPAWLGREVTDDPHFANDKLAEAEGPPNAAKRSGEGAAARETGGA
jgi:adenylate cyclase